MRFSRTALLLLAALATGSACADLKLEHVGAGGSAPSGSASPASASSTVPTTGNANGDSSSSAGGVGEVGGGGPGLLLFGDTTVEHSIDFHNLGTAEASAFTALAAGTVKTLSVYYFSGDTTELLVGLYDDKGGHPHTLLASGRISPPTPMAWNTASVSPEVPVDAGSIYWIALLGPLDSGVEQYGFPYLYLNQTLTTEHSSSFALSALPTTWAIGEVFAPSRNSFYASD